MTLATGTKLGPYEVTGAIGAGGMGEVYRARDTKLGRELALKVLPEAFAADSERLGRFEREAKVLASLNHPNIASIHGFEDSDGVHALVMELVEGQTLAEMISGVGAGLKRGSGVPEEVTRPAPTNARPIPIDEALQIAKQICDGLEYAHDRGIVHRDLKPANVKITPEGTVKLLDFGLAKALATETTASDISTSPTISRMATQAGIILGTAAYMSPEQAKGKPVDRRADVWAFGCVLYEMLTGKPSFDGETVTDVLAAVVMKDPDWNGLPADTPGRIGELLRRCLKKDSKQRLRDIGEARIAIGEAIAGAGADPGLGPGPGIVLGASVGGRTQIQRALPWAIVGVLAVALIAALVLGRFSSPAPSAPAELSLEIPSTQQLFTSAGPVAVMSPNGSRIAYVASVGGQPQIFVRELDKPQATPLEGALGEAPFFSPDGQWIGFFGSYKLEKVSVFGGAPITICDVTGARGAWWGEDGTIVFTPGVISPLERVSAAGGAPQPVTRLDAGRKEVTHRWPQILAGGKAVLFTASSDNNHFDHGDVEAASLATGEAKVLVENAYFGRYLAPGYLTYVSGGTLFAVPFDAKSLKVTGTAIPVIQDIAADESNGSAQFSASATGTAVYLTGKAVTSQVTVDLMDSKGAANQLVKQPGDYYAPRFSPDGRQLALQVGIGNIWIYDIAHETLTPLTFSPADCLRPVWTPDGKRIVCDQDNPAAGGVRLEWIPANGTGSLQSLTKPSNTQSIPSSWSPDGKTLAYFQLHANEICCEVLTVTLGPNGRPEEPKPLIGQNSSSAFAFPAFSPDGRWLAYASNESGKYQIYVVPYPGPGEKRQVSVSGGTIPRWSRTGHELFYMQATNPPAIVSVPYTATGNSFQPGTPEVLFQGGFEIGGYSSYDVAPDGQHFAVLVPAGGQSAESPLPTVVMNWSARVQKLVAAGQK